jgi:GntR family transcriptional regulator, arabinose operon transcriptional repressor
MAGNALYKSIAEKLSEDIRLGRIKGEMLPPESALCEQFATSRITVRGALKLLEDAGLVEAIPGKGRRIANPDKLLQPTRKTVKKQKSLRINCAIQYAHLPSYQIVFNLLSNLAANDGAIFQTHLIGNDGAEQSGFERALSAKESDGLLCVSITSPSLIERIESCGMPTVHINCCDPLVNHMVFADSFAGGYMAGLHLAKHGHRKILVLAESRHLASSLSEFTFKLNGFRSALSTIPGDEVKLDILNVERNGNLVAKRLSKGLPDAVFMLSDMLAEELSTGLSELGLQFPRDLSVIGFDNMINTEEDWKMEIDSIDLPWTSIAQTAYRQLMELIAGTPPPPAKTLLMPTLVAKGSVRQKKA